MTDVNVAVIYYSATGSVYALAQAAAQAAEAEGAAVRLRKVHELAPQEAIDSNEGWSKHALETQDVSEATLDDLEWADVVLLGTPTRYGLPTAQLKQFIDTTGPLWGQGKLVNKVASSFTSTGTAHGGQETTITALNNTFYHWGCIIVPPATPTRSSSPRATRTAPRTSPTTAPPRPGRPSWRPWPSRPGGPPRSVPRSSAASPRPEAARRPVPRRCGDGQPRVGTAPGPRLGAVLIRSRPGGRPGIVRAVVGLLALVLLVLTAAACSSDSSSGTTLDKVKASGVLRVGTEGTYSPFSYHDPTTNVLTGYDVEVVDAVAAKMGLRTEFVEAPFDSIFASLMADRFDLVANQVTKNPQRDATYALSKPYTVSDGVIVTRTDDDSITTLADLKGKTSAQSSTSSWAQVAKDAGAKVEAVEGFTQAVTLVKQRRVDATVNDNLAVAEYTRTTKDASVKIAAKTGDTSEQVFALRPGDTSLRDAVNTALDQVRTDGQLAIISKKYFDTDVSVGDAGAQAPAQTPAQTPAPPTSTWDLVRDSAGPMALATVKATIPLTAVSFVIGLVIALVVALMRLSPVRVVSQLARFYVSLIRGTPLLVQLFLIFYGLPALGLTFNSFTAAIIAFSLNVGGYAAEIIRSAILSVPRGQWEAAQTIGMGYATTLRRIVLPQAARTAVPPLSNTLISLVKDTSLASVVLVTELLRVAQVAAAPTFKFFALYGVAALYYWVVCLVLSFVQQRVETRLERYVAR